MAGEAHVFIACSLDGFIAGPGDDLSWLPGMDEGDAAAGDAGAPAGGDPSEPDAGVGGEPSGGVAGESPGDRPGAAEEPGTEEDHGFGAFFAQVGALLMGRRTYDVVEGFDSWYYGDKPVLVATSRPIEKPVAPTVRAVSGSPRELLATAREVAGDLNVYVDGGALIRSFLDEGLIDEMTVTVIPVILGSGIPLFAGAKRRTKLELIEMSPSGGKLVQLRYRPLTE